MPSRAISSLIRQIYLSLIHHDYRLTIWRCLVFGYVNKNDVIFLRLSQKHDLLRSRWLIQQLRSSRPQHSRPVHSIYHRRTRRQLHSDLATRRGAAPCAPHRFLNRIADVWGEDHVTSQCHVYNLELFRGTMRQPFNRSLLSITRYECSHVQVKWVMCFL